MKRIWIERLTAISFSLFFTLFPIEIFIRVAYTALPVSLQVLLRDVQRAPWITEHIRPEPIWYDHNAYQLVPKPNFVLTAPQRSRPRPNRASKSTTPMIPTSMKPEIAS